VVDIRELAPRFELQGVSREGDIQSYSLEELVDDSALILSVYVYDFSPVCTTQMCDTSQLEWMTLRDDVTVVGLSGDSPYAHQRFADEYDISYPLLSDTDRSVCASYGVLQKEKDGMKAVPQRSLFLIGPDRRIRYRWVAADNWDNWTNEPLYRIKSRLEGIEV
jgi:peroxiredoxin